MPAAQAAPTTKLIVVIDDDPAILEGMSGLLRTWGYRVVAAASGDAALARLPEQGQRPDLIICDYHLADGEIGTQTIERLRGAFEIPALLITAGAVPARPHEGRSIHYDLLHKPVNAAALRATLSRAFKR